MSYAYSAWEESSGSWASSAWWFKHPFDPDLSFALARAQIDSEPGFSRAARVDEQQPLGRSDAVFGRDTRGPRKGTIRVALDTAEERAAMDALLEANVSVLIQAPPGDHWPDRWVELGDQARGRYEDKLGIGDVFDTLPWTEVASPAGALVG